MATSKFHPALGVSNIKNHISIILDLEHVQYSTWAELFKITARSYKVLHHIISSDTIKAAESEADKAEWSTLDATVLGWIYATISTDLLQTIIEPGATAMEAWNRLKDIFQDNKNSRAVALEQEFSVSESCWLRNLLLELHCPLQKATLVYCDNVSAVYLSGNTVQHQRTKML